MKTIQYSIVDVFAQRKYTGNQLAVLKTQEAFQTKRCSKWLKKLISLKRRSLRRLLRKRRI